MSRSSVKKVSRTTIFGLSYALEDKILEKLYQPYITVICMRPPNGTRKPALERGLNHHHRLDTIAL